MDAFLLKPLMATDRVTPVRISAVYKNVTFFEVLGNGIEGLVNFRSCRNIDENGSWRRKVLAKIGKGANLNETRLNHIRWGSMPGVTNNVHPFLHSLAGKVSPHPTQTYDPILSLYMCHVVSPYFILLLPRSISGLLGQIHWESTLCFFAHKGRSYMSMIVVKPCNCYFSVVVSSLVHLLHFTITERSRWGLRPLKSVPPGLLTSLFLRFYTSVTNRCTSGRCK